MKKTELGQVFTNKTIAEYMVSLFSVGREEKILDPCFGDAVFIEALKKADFFNITGCEIDSMWYTSVSNRLSNVNLIKGDFLTYVPDENFSGIIMNPPYIRQERIDQLAEYGISKKSLFENKLFKTLPKTANLYMYFVIKGMSILKENGEMIVIFPSSWLDARNGTNFKTYLYNVCDVVRQIHIHGDVFDGTALVDVVILKVINRKGTGNTSIEYLTTNNGIIEPAKTFDNVFDLGFTKTFSNYGCVRRGLTTGYNELFINPVTSLDISEYLKPILSSPKDYSGYTTENARYDNILLISSKSVVSKELKKFISSFEDSIVALQKPKTLYERILKKERWYTLKPFDGKGIIFSYFVRNEMKFAINQSDVIIRDNFYVIKPNIDTLVMFALLNNFYSYYQLEKCGKMYGKGLLKLQRYDIESLLFPDIALFSEGDINNLLSLSQLMINSGNSEIIFEITRIISKYASVNYEKIVEVYKKTKQRRLENS